MNKHFRVATEGTLCCPDHDGPKIGDEVRLETGAGTGAWALRGAVVVAVDELPRLSPEQERDNAIAALRELAGHRPEDEYDDPCVRAEAVANKYGITLW